MLTAHVQPIEPRRSIVISLSFFVRFLPRLDTDRGVVACGELGPFRLRLALGLLCGRLRPGRLIGGPTTHHHHHHHHHPGQHGIERHLQALQRASVASFRCSDVRWRNRYNA